MSCNLLTSWTPLKTKLSIGGCLTTSEFICVTEQRGRSGEKAREGLQLVTLACNCAVTPSLINLCGMAFDAYSVNKQLSCRSFSTSYMYVCKFPRDISTFGAIFVLALFSLLVWMLHHLRGKMCLFHHTIVISVYCLYSLYTLLWDHQQIQAISCDTNPQNSQH